MAAQGFKRRNRHGKINNPKEKKKETKDSNSAALRIILSRGKIEKTLLT